MSKRKADDISTSKLTSSGTTTSEEVIEPVPVRSREKRRVVRKVTTNSTTNDQSNNVNNTEVQPSNIIVTNEVPSVVTVVKPITQKEEFSKKEKEVLDENFGKLMFTLGTYFHRGFSDFKLSAINELYKNSGEPFGVETLKMIQYIVPELFTIYFNHNQEICVNISNDFEKIKATIVGMWKKRIVTVEKPQSLEPQIETRALNIATTKPLPKIENSTDKTQQPKKSIEEMLKENDRKEQEEFERAKILSKKFEIDRVIETLLIMFT